MGWQPNYQSEGRIYAKYILTNHPLGVPATSSQG